ncbi:MAG: EamA family transporter, partial [Planctomycetes bacterium]|nr:EamA family transporter [Planctomycetota bacterium]
AATYPLVTMILAIFILKEGLSWEKVAGTTLIIAGIWLLKVKDVVQA